MLEKVAEQAYFIYSRDLEYVLAAQELLKPLRRNKNIAENIKEPDTEKYQILKEVYEGFGERIWGAILEPLTDCADQEFHLDSYETYLMQLSKEKLLSSFLQLPEEEIREALQQEENLLEFYQKHRECFQGYLPVEILFSKTEWFIKQFFSYVRELKTERADMFLTQQEEMIGQWKEELEEELKTKAPLTYSEELMQKTFYNRGPYETFYFMPSLFLPLKCCRWFGRTQVLIFDAKGIHEFSREMPQQLKMLSDKTRFRILKLLKDHGHLSGIELAESMNLATSTVSHHMTQLKNCGLVHEEPTKNTKYFSLNQVSIKNCIGILEDTFLK